MINLSILMSALPSFFFLNLYVFSFYRNNVTRSRIPGLITTRPHTTRCKILRKFYITTAIKPAAIT